MPEHRESHTLCKYHTHGSGCISDFTGLTYGAHALKCKKSICRTTQENSFWIYGWLGQLYLLYNKQVLIKKKKKKKKARKISGKIVCPVPHGYFRWTLRWTTTLQHSGMQNPSEWYNVRRISFAKKQKQLLSKEMGRVPLALLILGLRPDVRFAATARCGLLG